MSVVAEVPLPPFWRRPLLRDILWQTVIPLLLIAAIWFFVRNAGANLEKSSLVFGGSFLGGIASFELGSNLVGFAAGDPVYKALLVGIVNTLHVSVVAIVLATLLGILVGVARLSSNPLAAGLSRIYVEVARNVPLLLQLLFWYALITRALPSPRQAWELLPGFFLTNRGLNLPLPGPEPVYGWMLLAFASACVLVLGMEWRARRRPQSMPHRASRRPLRLALLVGAPALVFVLGGMPVSLDVPVMRGFGFHGGLSLPPEYVALLLGLTLYTGAFIAEIVRGGILGVHRGQIEAAEALGLSRGQCLRKIVLPQAMQIIVPPLGSQYVSLLKNSSLAVAIGYPDIVRVSTVVISETGHAIEMIGVMMIVYLLLSLITSALVNLYNRAVTREAR
ncbi:ABC transporter permease subunit [Geminicoccaceae bacterium 1502E]|nr:ABC transporter permease subunit [Geminicoccaceae bacterium 1502E]